MVDRSLGLVSPGTALAESADRVSTIDCGGGETGFSHRSESITYNWPGPDTLRTSRRWMMVPRAFRQPSLERVAHHEAGHAVVMRWFGLEPAKATATPTSGLCHFPTLPERTCELDPDPSGEIAATASAVFEGGAMAELLYLGIPWTGPLFHAEQPDYRHAEDFLRPAFGAHSSAGHGFAQRVALHVLQSRWAEVQEIARHLVVHGEWRSSELTASA